MRHFVQFPHPGAEARRDRTRWASAQDPHVRKFVRALGRYRRDVTERDAVGEIGFWAEWEAESLCESIPGGGKHGLLCWFTET